MTQTTQLTSDLDRVVLEGCTGSFTTTTIITTAPTLLQPIREDWVAGSNIGELRFATRNANLIHDAFVPSFLANAGVNGDMWLPTAGTWEITVASEAEDRVDGMDFVLPFVALRDPDHVFVANAMTGRGAGRAAYHAEQLVADEWNQVMDIRQRLIVKADIELQFRGSDPLSGAALKYRWGGPPSNPDGIAVQELSYTGHTLRLEGAPLASLWVRCSEPVDMNLLTQRPR